MKPLQWTSLICCIKKNWSLTFSGPSTHTWFLKSVLIENTRYIFHTWAYPTPTFKSQVTHYVPPAKLELTMHTRLALNSQGSTCFCNYLLRAGIKDHVYFCHFQAPAKIGRGSSAWWQLTVFQNSTFRLKLHILLLATKAGPLFPWNSKLTYTNTKNTQVANQCTGSSLKQWAQPGVHVFSGRRDAQYQTFGAQEALFMQTFHFTMEHERFGLRSQDAASWKPF